MEFIKLSETTLPEPNTLVWCKRKSGSLYLATRNREEFSDSDDPSVKCHWYGFPQVGDWFSTNGRDMEHTTNFSDITVESFAYIQRPVI